MVEGIVYCDRTGVPWRDLPVVFGPWQTVGKRHHCFATDGTGDAISTQVFTAADAAGELDWSVSVDWVRARRHGAG